MLLEPFLASKPFMPAADELLRGLSMISKSSELLGGASAEMTLDDSRVAVPAAAPAGLKLCVPLIMSDSLALFFPLAC